MSAARHWRRAATAFALALAALAPMPPAAKAQADPSSRTALPSVARPDTVLDRAYGLLAEGNLTGAREALIASVAVLPPEMATPAVQLANLLDRLPPEAATALADAELAARRGDGAAAADSLAAWATPFVEPVRAALLAHAARLADRWDSPGVAAVIRERILGELPGQPEVGEAALSLARHLATSPDGVPRAVSILEDLITRRPNAAVAPAARVELDRLRERGG